jgi:CheY-like chemotaxis protein
MDKLRVLIAEDREELRATIIELLRAEFTVVGDVGDGQKLVETASSLKPDIIVSDIDMPLLDGFSAMRILRTKGIEAPFVFITSMAVEGPSSAVEDHPVGFVHKADLMNELRSALHAVAFGISFLSRSFRRN